MPGGHGIFASSRALESNINCSHRYKVGPVEIECIGTKTVVKFTCTNSTYHVYCTDKPRGRELVQLNPLWARLEMMSQ